MPSFLEGTTIKPTAHRPTRPVTMRILEKVRHVELLKPAVEKPIHVFCEEEFPPCSGHDTTTSLKLAIPTRLFQIFIPGYSAKFDNHASTKKNEIIRHVEFMDPNLLPLLPKKAVQRSTEWGSQQDSQNSVAFDFKPSTDLKLKSSTCRTFSKDWFDQNSSRPR